MSGKFEGLAKQACPPGRKGRETGAAAPILVQFDSFHRRPGGVFQRTYLAWTLWGIALLMIVIRLLVPASARRDVFPVFSSAARHWIHGQDLYMTPANVHNPDRGPYVYVYSPLVAALLTP